MRLTIRVAILFAMCASPGAAAQVDAGRWAEAEHHIRRLDPESYRGLPGSVSAYLRRHGFTIPQSSDVDRQHNVVRGRFDADAAEDWAVLASRDGASQILVFWGGSAANVASLNRRPDAEYLQTIGGGAIGYSRSISAVGRDHVLERYRGYGGAEPPRIGHDAIDDGFSGKASEVYYFDGRRWLVLQGAD